MVLENGRFSKPAIKAVWRMAKLNASKRFDNTTHIG
jgi:hypothetical protein